ncbi:MAG TPA: GNAT family protein [Bacteroidia bacterium]|jgi:RimJ/RimL family protein N-acetyltransferase|nr:GNAT family protein [Bacteroidia bacterium]
MFPGTIDVKMIELEPFNKSDFSRLISWIHSGEMLLQFAGGIFKHPLTHQQLHEYLKDENRIAFKVLYKQTNEIIGHAEIMKMDDHHVKICRIIIGDQNQRGKGYGQALMKELVIFAAEKLKAKSIELNVYDWNTSAIKCYERVGFKINPLKSKTVKFKDEVEWKAVNMVFKP